jgi:hypothetical protein
MEVVTYSNQIFKHLSIFEDASFKTEDCQEKLNHLLSATRQPEWGYGPLHADNSEFGKAILKGNWPEKQTVDTHDDEGVTITDILLDTEFIPDSEVMDPYEKVSSEKLQLSVITMLVSRFLKEMASQLRGLDTSKFPKVSPYIEYIEREKLLEKYTPYGSSAKSHCMSVVNKVSHQLHQIALESSNGGGLSTPRELARLVRNFGKDTRKMLDPDLYTSLYREIQVWAQELSHNDHINSMIHSYVWDEVLRIKKQEYTDMKIAAADRTEFNLDPDKAEEFFNELDTPSGPNEALRKLMTTPSTFE